MDTPNISRKRKFDDSELNLNDTSVSQGSEGINKNLLKCLVGLTKHIIDVHNNKYESVIKLEDDESGETDVPEQNIAKQPHFDETLDDSLWNNISLLKQQTAELEKIYNTPQSNSARDSLNQINYTAVDNLLRANVVQHLSENSANLTEQICNLISMYKSEQSEETARDIRKCLSKINKKIKAIPLQSDVFFPSLNKSNLSNETNAYLTAADNLSDKLSVLIKKVSKLKKIYKKRVLNLDKSEPMVKKRNISNNESIIIHDNDDTFNNNANSKQITNNNALTEMSTVDNDNSIVESLDKSILEPYNSNYVNELLDSYVTITNNAKRKRKLKKTRVLNGNLGINNVTVEAIVHNDEIVDTVETRITNPYDVLDVVIKIESDDNSVEIMKEKRKTMHGVLVQNNENVVEERLKKTVEKKNKSVENSNVKKKRKSVENSNENVQEILVRNNENSTATVSEETPKKTGKKKRKSVENSTENSQEIFDKNNENSTATVSEESPKKTDKKKKKSVENSTENVQEILVKNNENSTGSVSEGTPKKTGKKKKIIVEILNENVQEILIKNNENSTETVCEENPKKIAKKKKSVENSNDTAQEILDKNNENSTATVSEETPKKTGKKRKKSVDNSNENTQEILVGNNETSVEVNDEKTRREKQKKKTKSNGGMTENILNDILHHICGQVVQDNENESLIERNHESNVNKRRKDERNKENVSVLEDSDNSGNTTKVKRKKKITDSCNVEVEGNQIITDVTESSMEKKKRKSCKEKIKSVEFIDENSSDVSSTNNKRVSKKKLKKKVKKHKNRKENSSGAVLVENKEINCKRKDKKREKSTECRIGQSSGNMEIFLIDKNGTSGNVNVEIASKKKGETMGNIKIELWENRKNVPNSEELSAKLPENRNSLSLSETTVPNNEIPDDIFSSVFKIEPLDDDDDDLDRDSNVNFVPLNACLQDEDLDEKEQYLYLRELVGTAKEKMELSAEAKDRLRSLSVLLDFNVPAAHTIENNLCKGPTREQAQQMAALGVKPGRLTKDEDEIIRRNWASFCKAHDLPNNPMPFLTFKHGRAKIISYEDRRKFVQYLGKDLPHRALHSIYHRFKILFKVTKDGRFSQDEDMLILSYVKFSRHMAKFADLMPVLNRPRASIEARYRVLKKALTRVTWDLNLKAELIKHMKQVMEVENVGELQHADITHAHLAEVAKRMNLAVVKIRHQWCTKLYTQLFAVKPLYLDQMKVDLVDRLYELKLDDWRKVNWCEVAKTFPGVSPVSLRVLMKTLFRHNCPKKLQTDLGAIINHCRTITMPELKSRPEFNQRCIYRLKLNKDGCLREYI